MSRVVRIQSRICVGGPALHSIILTRGLSYAAGSRYDTTLFGGRLEDGESSMAAFAAQRGVEINVVPSMGRAVRPGQDARAVADVARRIRAVRPSVVHTHTAKAGAIGRTAAMLNRVPIIVHTFHGHIFDGYFSPRKTKLFVQVERSLARVTDVILSLSNQQREDLIEKYRIAPAEKVRVLPLGLELDRFRAIDRRDRGSLRRSLGLDQTTPLILAVGRIVPIKRFDLLIEAFKRLLPHCPSAHLAIAGDGAPADKAGLEALAASVADRVHFLGWRRDQDVLYTDADVLALTSDNEGTPVTVIEAITSGVPVVATRVGGVEDIVSDEMGTLVRPGAVEEIAAALKKSLDRPTSLREALRDRIATRFSHRRLVRDMTELYDELIDRKRLPQKAEMKTNVGKEVTA